MSLDDYTPDLDQSEGLGSGVESQSEKVSEAFKKAVKKASAGIGRTKKDEKKAKKYDFLLAGFLVKIIVDKKYDSLLGVIFSAMDEGYSSNFILGILSIINIQVSNKIRELSQKEAIIFNYQKTEEKISFDDHNLNDEVRNRINYWIEDIIDSVTIEYSHIQTKKIIKLLEKDNTKIINFTAQVFTFFLYQIHITITKQKSLSICEFVIMEIEKALRNIDIEEV